MSSWIQLTSINPPGPVWVNLDSGYYMNGVATDTAIHFGSRSTDESYRSRSRASNRLWKKTVLSRTPRRLPPWRSTPVDGPRISGASG